MLVFVEFVIYRVAGEFMEKLLTLPARFCCYEKSPSTGQNVEILTGFKISKEKKVTDLREECDFSHSESAQTVVRAGPAYSCIDY